MHANSILIFEKYALKYFRPNMRILEIGPDKFPSSYKTIVGIDSINWDTLDIYKNPNLTYSATEELHYPIQDNQYDIILSGNVLEHVPKVWIWIKELARICKEGGLIITVNPVYLGYHPHPVDCWRAFPEGMKALYEEAGIKVILLLYETLDVLNPRYTLRMENSLCSKTRFIVKMMLHRLNFPVKRLQTYDTITIGKK